MYFAATLVPVRSAVPACRPTAATYPLLMAFLAKDRNRGARE